ncbi:uncharacterized protein LOC111015337 [Momordica charantia]|uniref:Uncharacterized protein LOC111015337 n=1 Tax=Momordica charantia TaxID=3673 RepID=A0A6J1CXH3_MOMCH|nr:uncharacterized protein LOC111015337 [Momordica charantia]
MELNANIWNRPCPQPQRGSVLFFSFPPLFCAQKMESESPCPTFHKSKSSPSPLLWDCGSTLYDSFELNSLKRQLDSAMASRTLSMSHLPGRHVAPPPPPPSKRPSISRSFHKFLRSVFRHKQNSNFEAREGALGYSLSAIPEPQFRGLSPEIGCFVRRAASERFTPPTSIGISCA